MANFLTELFNPKPQGLEIVRASLDADFINDKELIPLLEEHHDYLLESIDVLMDVDASIAEKRENLIRFFRLVEMHGRAEEETLYEHLRANSDDEARLEGWAGLDEHDIAFQLEDELLELGYLTTWSDEIAAKAKVVAGLVKNHINEEESNMFRVAEKDFSTEEMRDLAEDYIRKCKVYLDDSANRSAINRTMRTSSKSVDLQY